MREEISKNKWDGGFVGKRKEEAFKRRKEIDYRGVLFFDNGTNVFVCYPLAEWSVTDVWAYIIGNDIPYHECYDMENCGQTHRTLRVGIMFDTSFHRHGEFVWLKHNYPSVFNEFMLKFPNMQEFR